ncbi:MAG: sigma-70 family RNA polymerase sigma factor [Planctomycetes bacterium]|nr:sigma-70 family RNA polymerase sigma factor [Planctomycetota bacterium]
MDDPGQALAVRYQMGRDPADFERLVLHYRDRVYRVIYRLVGDADEAMDLTQEAMLRVHRSLDQWDHRAAFFTWLYRLAVNLAIDHHRRRSRDRAVPYGEDFPFADPRPGEVERYDEDEERDVLLLRVRRAILDLPEAQRAIVVLRHYEHLPLARIAEVRGVALGTVKSTLFAAFRSLRRALEAEGKEKV